MKVGLGWGVAIAEKEPFAYPCLYSVPLREGGGRPGGLPVVRDDKAGQGQQEAECCSSLK